MITQQQLDEVKKQLAEPDYVWLMIGGDFLRHAESGDSYFLGQRIRFTRLAAERFCSKYPNLYRIVPAETK